MGFASHAHKRIAWGLFFASVLAGCTPRPAETSNAVEPVPAEPAAEPDPRAKETPDGTLASVHGKFGLLEVTQHAGRRSLLIDGVVQGSAPMGGALAPQDALVEVVAASHPGPGRAVVLGLGTGATARALEHQGFDVLVAEHEPEIIALAREWFGYTGHATPADGLAFLREHEDPARVVLVDAFDGTKLPSHLADRAAMKVYRSSVGDDGILAFRLLGQPSDLGIQSVLERLGREFHFAHMLGSGVGDEPQNLYVLASNSGINLVTPKGLPMRPLWMNRGPGLEVLTPQEEPGVVVIAGYVTTTPEHDRVALDVAHAEMGAVRFLVSGPAEDALRPMVASQKFPTRGDIRSDGPTSGTLVTLAGGGGVKRSDVRMSAVVAAVRGTARVVAVVHPDTVFAGRSLERRETQDEDGIVGLHAELPYGGVLYELVDAQVKWTVTASEWRTLERGPLRKSSRRAHAALGRGELKNAVEELGEWLALVTARLGPEASILFRVANVVRARDILTRAVGRKSSVPQACQAALGVFLEWGDDPLAKALETCAARRAKDEPRR